MKFVDISRSEKDNKVVRRINIALPKRMPPVPKKMPKLPVPKVRFVSKRDVGNRKNLATDLVELTEKWQKAFGIVNAKLDAGVYDEELKNLDWTC